MKEKESDCLRFINLALADDGIISIKDLAEKCSIKEKKVKSLIEKSGYAFISKDGSQVISPDYITSTAKRILSASGIVTVVDLLEIMNLKEDVILTIFESLDKGWVKEGLTDFLMDGGKLDLERTAQGLLHTKPELRRLVWELGIGVITVDGSIMASKPIAKEVLEFVKSNGYVHLESWAEREKIELKPLFRAILKELDSTMIEDWKLKTVFTKEWYEEIESKNENPEDLDDVLPKSTPENDRILIREIMKKYAVEGLTKMDVVFEYSRKSEPAPVPEPPTQTITRVLMTDPPSSIRHYYGTELIDGMMYSMTEGFTESPTVRMIMVYPLGDKEKALMLQSEALRIRGLGFIYTALKILSDAFRLDQTNYRILATFQETLYVFEKSRGRSDLVIRLIASDIERFPNIGVLWRTLGVIQSEIGNLEDAEKSLLKAIELEQNDLFVYDLAVVLRKAREDKRALDLIEEHLVKNPESVLLLRTHADIHQMYGNLEKAETSVRKALSIADTDARLHILLGDILLRHGDKKEGEKEIEVALQLAPDNPLVRTVLGGVYLKIYRFDDARREYNEALRISPGYKRAIDGLTITEKIANTKVDPMKRFKGFEKQLLKMMEDIKDE